MLIISPWHALLLAADVSNFTLSGGSKEKKTISLAYNIAQRINVIRKVQDGI